LLLRCLAIKLSIITVYKVMKIRLILISKKRSSTIIKYSSKDVYRRPGMAFALTKLKISTYSVVMSNKPILAIIMLYILSIMKITT